MSETLSRLWLYHRTQECRSRNAFAEAAVAGSPPARSGLSDEDRHEWIEISSKASTFNATIATCSKSPKQADLDIQPDPTRAIVAVAASPILQAATDAVECSGTLNSRLESGNHVCAIEATRFEASGADDNNVSVGLCNSPQNTNNVLPSETEMVKRMQRIGPPPLECYQRVIADRSKPGSDPLSRTRTTSSSSDPGGWFPDGNADPDVPIGGVFPPAADLMNLD